MQGLWGQQRGSKRLGQPSAGRRLLLHGDRQTLRLSANRPGKSSGDPQQQPSSSTAGSTDSSRSPSPSFSEAAAAALPQSPSTAAPSASPFPLPAAAGQHELQAAVLQAQQELRASWQQLKDAAGLAFVPGYGSRNHEGADGGTQPAANLNKEQLYRMLLKQKTYRGQLQSAITNSSSSSSSSHITSLPDGLKRLLTLEFLKPQQSTMEDRQQQGLRTQIAAMQFELNQTRQERDSDKQQAQQQQQQQQDTPPSPGQVPASRASAPAAPEDPQPPGGQLGPSAASAVPPQPAPRGGTGDTAVDTANFYPATAQVLVLATWAVFALQWWSALPELWLAVKEGCGGRAMSALLLLFPDNGVTRAVCLDLHCLQAGTSLTGMITSGLTHSGLLATLLNTAALFDAGRCLEAGMGSMQLISTCLMASVCASLAHLVAGTSMLGVGGSGMVVGVYAAWVLQAKLHVQEDINMKELYIAAGVLAVLNLLLGMVQPAVGFASLLGGLFGGLLAVKFGGSVSEALYWGLSGPFMAVLLVIRLVFDGLKLLAAAGAVVVVVSVQWVLGMAQSVKRM